MRRATPGPLSIAAAGEACCRWQLGRHLPYPEALEPGYLLRATRALDGITAVSTGDAGGVSTAALYEIGRLILEHEYRFADGLGNGTSHARREHRLVAP